MRSKTLGHPRAALLGFAVAVLAYKRAVAAQGRDRADPSDNASASDVSTYHLTVEINSTYEGMIASVPPEHLPCADSDPQRLLQRLLALAARLSPKQLTTSKRGPKTGRPNAGYVSDSIASSHVSTDRVIKGAGKRR